jgi:hypothetical protein
MARFVKGQSGNPAGKPLGTRHKLNEAFIRDLNEIWAQSGKGALERLAISEPAKLVEAVGRTLPKELAVSLEQRNSLGVDPQLWSGFQRVLQAIEECVPPDANPVDVFESLEQMVRAHFAKQIEPSADASSALLVQKCK